MDLIGKHCGTCRLRPDCDFVTILKKHERVLHLQIEHTSASWVFGDAICDKWEASKAYLKSEERYARLIART